MITEDYCSYEVSKLLNEKGFNGMCDTVIGRDGTKYDIKLYDYVEEETTSCPTHQMAMKWLREKWIFIEISFSVTINGEPCYNFGILSRSAQWVYRHKQSFYNYEEAVEAAIKYSLENLI